jgi:hypothetical protein
MKNLVSALVKFQKIVPIIPKNKKNPFYNSYYADLSKVIDVSMPALNAVGLAITQLLDDVDGRNLLITMLAHESGESIQSKINLPAIADPQKLTAAITYLRRAQYLAILGLCADDDDDGNSVSHQAPKAPAQQTNKQSPPAYNIAQNVATHISGKAPKTGAPASLAQVNAIKKLYGPDFDTEGLNVPEASALIASFNNKGK